MIGWLNLNHEYRRFWSILYGEIPSTHSCEKPEKVGKNVAEIEIWSYQGLPVLAPVTMNGFICVSSFSAFLASLVIMTSKR